MTSKVQGYINRYNKENYKSYQIRVKKSDKELINKLDSVLNRNAYIASLIRGDINPGVLSIKEIKILIRPVISEHGIKDVYLFGSYARGEANASSDVDIYCDPGDAKSLLDQAKLIIEFENALNKKVDVVTIGSQMHEYFRKQLDEDKIKIC